MITPYSIVKSDSIKSSFETLIFGMLCFLLGWIVALSFNFSLDAYICPYFPAMGEEININGMNWRAKS